MLQIHLALTWILYYAPKPFRLKSCLQSHLRSARFHTVSKSTNNATLKQLFFIFLWCYFQWSTSADSVSIFLSACVQHNMFALYLPMFVWSFYLCQIHQETFAHVTSATVMYVYNIKWVELQASEHAWCHTFGLFGSLLCYVFSSGWNLKVKVSNLLEDYHLPLQH